MHRHVSLTGLSVIIKPFGGAKGCNDGQRPLMTQERVVHQYTTSGKVYSLTGPYGTRVMTSPP